MVAQDFWLELDVSGLVDTVDVSESGSDAETRSDFAESGIDVEDVFRLGIKTGVVNAGVVYTIFLTSGDSDLHLEPEADRGHAREVFDAGSDVFFFGLLGEIEHVGGEEGFTVLFVVSLVSGEHTIEPRKEFLGAMVRVQYDGTAARNRTISERYENSRTFETYTPYSFATVRI